MLDHRFSDSLFGVGLPSNLIVLFPIDVVNIVHLVPHQKVSFIVRCICLKSGFSSSFMEMRQRHLADFRRLLSLEDGLAGQGHELFQTANHLFILLLLIFIQFPQCLSLFYNQVRNMEGIVDYLASLLHLTSLDENKQLEFIEKKTGIKPSAFVIAILVFLVIITLISNATSLVVAIGCCVAPAYFTFLVLESQSKQTLKKYLIYWIIYAFMELIGPALTLMIPSIAYILMRVGLAVLLLHPKSKIAEKLFGDLIQPFLTKYQSEIDQNIENAIEKGKEGLKKGQNYVQEYVKK